MEVHVSPGTGAVEEAGAVGVTASAGTPSVSAVARTERHVVTTPRFPSPKPQRPFKKPRLTSPTPPTPTPPQVVGQKKPSPWPLTPRGQLWHISLKPHPVSSYLNALDFSVLIDRAKFNPGVLRVMVPGILYRCPEVSLTCDGPGVCGAEAVLERLLQHGEITYRIRTNYSPGLHRRGCHGSGSQTLLLDFRLPSCR